MGLLSNWASANFANQKDKNAYYAKIGKSCTPAALDRIAHCGPEMSKEKVLEAILPK